ncbi:MAG: hypothetical protein M1814_001983 [Vezdaea aestivalis]|nr:MAG: hypothetical protein M1814_001983 [Vezdaea aestivalis]
MGSTQFGNFHNFCRDSTLPVCNVRINILFGVITGIKADNLSLQLFNEGTATEGFGGCSLTGIPLSNNRQLANLGVILLCAIAIVTSALLLWRSERKKAAVGRREMQLFLLGYMLVSLCEIFTVGGFPLDEKVRMGFTAAHLAAITATTWLLLMNAAVGFQLLEDGTIISLALVIGSALALFIGTGYVALDTGFTWTGRFESSLNDPNRNIALYILYLLAPLVFVVVFFVLESVLVLRVLREFGPMRYLAISGLLFAIGQVFQFVVSTHICKGTNGKIDGSLFETLFTLGSVVVLWLFWSSITEDEWPTVEPSYT